MNPATDWAVEDLGQRTFRQVHEQMRELAASIAAGTAGGKVWLVEHEGVYTAGRASPPEPSPPDQSPPNAIPVERGGRLTWHGPGQLVIYPIVPLPRRDVRAWLTGLEQFGIEVCRSFGLRAEASVDGTGVFVDGRKLASIGVAVRRWVNLHGIALNLDVDPRVWHAIQPCGLDPAVMTDLTTASGQTIDRAEVVHAIRNAVPILTRAAESNLTESPPPAR